MKGLLLVTTLLTAIGLLIYGLYKGYRFIHSRFGDIWAGVYIAGIIIAIKYLDSLV